MATAQSHGNQISMENWSSPFWSPSLLGISMWFSSFCSFFPKSDVTHSRIVPTKVILHS